MSSTDGARPGGRGIVVQIAPEIAAGSGVGGVAHHLEQVLAAAGVPTERFTMTEAGGGWLPEPGRGVVGKLVLLVRVVWFSTVGTVAARRFLRARPDAVSICHNDVLAGDVYVNHGILRAAMQARGQYVLRMVRNPLHLFTAVRDRIRYRSGVHRAVVSLTRAEAELLAQVYPGLRPRSVVIGNGVDVERFRPASDAERSAARATVDPAGPLPDDAVVVVFVGHEFDRKGLPQTVAALAGAPPAVHLLVVGGTDTMVAEAAGWADRHGVRDRVHLVGRLSDPRPALHAADAFVLASAYEANALVVLEALASGLPVLVTPVGFVPEVVVEGRNGFLVEREAASIRAGLERLVAADRTALGAAARESALPLAWDRIGRRYLDLLAEVGRQPGRRP